MLISVKPLAKNLCIRFGTWKVRRLNQSRSKIAPNWKAKFPAFLFYGLSFLETQFKAIILNKDCHDCYYTVTDTQKARNVLLEHRRPDVVCVHNMDKTGWVVESPMNYTIECCHGDACRGLSEAICGAFPQHLTINQCFTPTMFSAYHREGCRASMEAEVEEFMFDEGRDDQWHS